MSIQHFNNAKTIARAADRIGAVLPTDIATAVTHLEAIATGSNGAPQPGLAARALAAHLGDPAAMEKARKAAALELATADARSRIDAYLVETCAARLHGMMSFRREEIASSFGAALADDLDTLTANAGRLPSWFKPTQADRLTDGLTFEAWTLARDAHDRIAATQNALAFLYRGAIDQQHAESFPVLAAQTLRYAKPAPFKTSADAYAFRDAINGRVSPAREGAAHGPVSVDGLFIPTLLAQMGATFEWATPTEVGARAALIVAGMVREPVAV